MMTKRAWLIAFLVVFMCLVLPMGGTEAATTVKKSEADISIEFEKTIDSSRIKPPKPKPPTITGGGHKPNSKLLPQTGEMITSIIIMLVGISIAVFVLGLMVLKQVYKEPSWEC